MGVSKVHLRPSAGARAQVRPRDAHILGLPTRTRQERRSSASTITYQEMLHTYQEKQQQKQQQKQHEQQQRDSRSSNAKAVAEATHAEPAQAMRYAAM